MMRVSTLKEDGDAIFINKKKKIKKEKKKNYWYSFCALIDSLIYLIITKLDIIFLIEQKI